MESFTQDDLYHNTDIYANTDSYEITDIYDVNNISDKSDSDVDTLTNSCPICRENYNKNTRCAHVIFPCGHSFCKECIDKISLCAICRKPIENNAVNWGLQSKISTDVELEIINPIYHIFIKLKDKIEEMYIKYQKNNISINLSVEQKKLINQVLLGLRNSDLNEIDINQLLIPEWLKNGINDKIDNILDYQSIIEKDLINFLPFCP